MRRYALGCKLTGLVELPPTGKGLGAFILHGLQSANSTKSISAVDGASPAISFHVSLEGYLSLVDDPRLARVLRGIRQSLEKRAIPRRPFVAEDVGKMIDVVSESEDWAVLRSAALMVLAYNDCGWISSFV
jgi:hypothetical protein